MNANGWGQLLCALALGVLATAASAGTPRELCTGDCDGDGAVSAADLELGLRLVFDTGRVATCPRFDSGGDGRVAAGEIVEATSVLGAGCAPTPTPSPTGSPTPTATATATPTTAAPDAVPTTAGELLAWLEAGRYLDWTAESAPHASAGPHFGRVRTFVNAALLESLQSATAAHPAGAAAVKELYGSGSEVRGWSVMVKVEEASGGGAGWYWYERFGTSVFAAGLGAGACTGCHALGVDFFRSPYPLP